MPKINKQLREASYGVEVAPLVEARPLSLIRVNNPFDRHDRDISVLEYKKGQTLLDIRNTCFPENTDVAVTVNGELVTEALAISYPMEGDQILMVPVFHDGDTANMVAMVALAAVAVAFVQPWLLAAMPAGMGAGTAMFWSALGTGLFVVGGSMLINAILPLSTPSIDGAESSQTYSWSPQTTQKQGGVIPKFYGTNKLYGNIISSWTDTNSDGDSYIYAIICLGNGPYKSLTDFKLNDQYVNKDGYDGLDDISINYASSMGYLTQTLNKYFQITTKTEYPLSVQIVKEDPNTGYTYTTQGDNFNALEVEVSFPYGLYHMESDGDVGEHSVSVSVEVSPTGVGSWTHIATQNGYWQARYDDPNNPGTWVVYKSYTTKNDINHYTEGEATGAQASAWSNQSEQMISVNTFWHWYATDIQNYLTITGAQTSSLVKKFTYNVPSYGKYDIRVINLTANQTATSYGDDLYFSMVRETLFDMFTYPKRVLVCVRALASDQLSGSFNFSCIAETSYVCIYNSSGSVTSVVASDNPAWVAVDILTKPVFNDNLTVARYDGYNPSRLDMAKFVEWAAFCDELVPSETSVNSGATWKALSTAAREADAGEKRVTFNGGFDTMSNVWESVLAVCQVGRAIPYFYGTKLTLIIDKEGTPQQLFTVGNIGKDSFKETFLPFADRASELEITFTNADNDYQREIYSYFSPEIDTEAPSISLDLKGLTKSGEVSRAANYRLAGNQYLIRAGEFEAASDSIISQPGDIINLQHDIPGWSVGGRLVAATSTSVTLDKTVTIESGKTYKILVRLSNNPTPVEKTITNTPGDYTVLTISVAFSVIPLQYDVFAFYEVTVGIKPVRITDIQRKADFKSQITWIEYNSSIYDVDYNVPAKPTRDYSTLDLYPSVTDIVLDEILIKGQDGSLIDCIDVYYNNPGESTFSYAEIWYKTGSDFQYAGDAQAGYYRIENVSVNKTYTVAVRTINTLGGKQALDNAPTASVYTFGKLAPPADVSIFSATVQDAGVKLAWTHITDVDLWGYEIGKGTSWDTAEIVVTGVSKDSYFWAPPEGTSGLQTFLIKAIDTSNIYSLNAKSTTIQIDPPDAVSNITYQVIDNFVLLYWTGVPGTFPITSYEVRKGDSATAFASATSLGEITGTFTTIFETQSGNYTYWIRAKDTAGLWGTEASTTATVNQPPDYILNADDDDEFSGTKTNIVEETLIGYHVVSEGLVSTTASSAVITGEDVSWINDVSPGDIFQIEGDTTAYTVLTVNSDTQITLTSTYPTTRTNLNYTIKAQYEKKFYVCGNTTETFATYEATLPGTTMQDWVDAVTYAIQPMLTTAQYVKEMDYGAAFSSSSITATLDKSTLQGTITVTPTISIKANSGDPWIDYVGNWQVYGTNFRYVKITLNFAGTATDILNLNNLNIRLDVKIRSDAGNSTVNAGSSTTVSGSTTNSIILTAGGGSNFAVNDIIKVGTIGNSAITAINTDTLTISPALGSAPGSGISVSIVGKRIYFTVSFLDITAITVTPGGTVARIGIYDFADDPNPEYADFYIFDKDGNYATPSVFSWGATGY